jgi:hypothetical protein
MIDRATGEVDFRSGLHIAPHCLVEKLVTLAGTRPKFRTQTLSLKGWKRHVLGAHDSEHGTFEVEALSSGGDRIQVVLLAHQHAFYEPNTPEDAERRAFHDGIIHRLETKPNKDWLVVAYSHEARMPLPDRDDILRLLAHEIPPGDIF